LSSEYQVRLCHKPNPAANEPTLRIRLTGRYDTEAGPSEAVPKPYRDSEGNYVFKTLVDNIKMDNAALDDLNPTVANYPVVIQARLLCQKALEQ
jgi:hypothetical protein